MVPRQPGDVHWLRQARGAIGDLDLVCFPHAGAGAAAYRQWQVLFTPRVRILAVQLPGRENRMDEAGFDRAGPLLDELVPALCAELTGPFAFFGHSMGAMLAFEAARRLRDQGRPGPTHLFVSGRYAPQIPEPDPPIGHLPTEEFLRAVHDLNGLPHEVLANADLMRLVEPALRADFLICERYRYRDAPPLDCPVSVLGGIGDAIPVGALAAWQAQTTAGFRLRLLPGDHFFLHSAPDQVARVVLDDLGDPAAAHRSADKDRAV